MKELEAAPDACKSNVLGQLVKKDPAIATAMVIDTLLAGIDTVNNVTAENELLIINFISDSACYGCNFIFPSKKSP